jgi:hypothetical protein
MCIVTSPPVVEICSVVALITPTIPDACTGKIEYELGVLRCDVVKVRSESPWNWIDGSVK